MTDTTETVLDSLRQPEYVGENRCTPCTVVNVAIAAAASAAVALVSIPGAVAAFAACLGVIYLRGYLVPYTPALTKQYLPDRVLAWFDKPPSEPLPIDEDGLVDVEATLLSMGVVGECEGGEDLCLDPGFRRTWRRRAADLDGEDARRRAIAAMLDVEEAELSFREFGSAVVVRYEGQQVGQWESDAALVGDLAADRTLAERSPRWTDLDPVNRSRLLNSLRMFLERCPACGGPAHMGQETVESCCRSMDVVAVTCGDCDARLFELELSAGMAEAL